MIYSVPNGVGAAIHEAELRDGAPRRLALTAARGGRVYLTAADCERLYEFLAAALRKDRRNVV